MPNTKLKEMLIVHEGIRHHPYKDSVGKLTVGVGRCLDSNGLSDDEIDYLLDNDIARCKRELVKFPFYSSLNNARLDALLDMLFNLGLTRFSKFNKMILALNSGLWEVAAHEALDSKWARQVGKRADEIAMVIATGEYQDG